MKTKQKIRTKTKILKIPEARWRKLFLNEYLKYGNKKLFG